MLKKRGERERDRAKKKKKKVCDSTNTKQQVNKIPTVLSVYFATGILLQNYLISDLWYFVLFKFAIPCIDNILKK